MTTPVTRDEETPAVAEARPVRCRHLRAWPAGAVMTFAGMFLGSYLADPFAVAFRVIFVIGVILLARRDPQGRS